MTIHQRIDGAALHHHEPVIESAHCAIISPQLGIILALLAITPSMHGAKSMTVQMIELNTPEEMLAYIARLQADNDALKANASNPRKLSMKVSDKGALSVYGLGRFPVTLYRGQWERLLSEAESIIAFVAVNADRLTVKA